jgi:hypothetical protein
VIVRYQLRDSKVSVRRSRIVIIQGELSVISSRFVESIIVIVLSRYRLGSGYASAGSKESLRTQVRLCLCRLEGVVTDSGRRTPLRAQRESYTVTGAEREGEIRTPLRAQGVGDYSGLPRQCDAVPYC